MEKQTALQEFIQAISNSGIVIINQTLIDNCLQMEKEQIRNAFNDGYRSGHFEDHKLGSKYFEEYYKK